MIFLILRLRYRCEGRTDEPIVQQHIKRATHLLISVVQSRYLLIAPNADAAADCTSSFLLFMLRSRIRLETSTLDLSARDCSHEAFVITLHAASSKRSLPGIVKTEGRIAPSEANI